MGGSEVTERNRLAHRAGRRSDHKPARGHVPHTHPCMQAPETIQGTGASPGLRPGLAAAQQQRHRQPLGRRLQQQGCQVQGSEPVGPCRRRRGPAKPQGGQHSLSTAKLHIGDL